MLRRRDRVTITVARWRAGHLEIEATSTDPHARLTAFVHDDLGGGLIDVLPHDGAGCFARENPGAITVRSSAGGAASARVDARRLR